MAFIQAFGLFICKSRQTVLCLKRGCQLFPLITQALPTIVEKGSHHTIIPFDLLKQSVLGIIGQLVAQCRQTQQMGIGPVMAQTVDKRGGKQGMVSQIAVRRVVTEGHGGTASKVAAALPV